MKLSAIEIIVMLTFAIAILVIIGLVICVLIKFLINQLRGPKSVKDKQAEELNRMHIEDL